MRYWSWLEKIATERISVTPGFHHTWLNLPPSWRAGEFTAAARRRDVIVTPSEILAADRTDVPEAVRICIGMPRHCKQLALALDILSEILREPVIGSPAIV